MDQFLGYCEKQESHKKEKVISLKRELGADYVQILTNNEKRILKSRISGAALSSAFFAVFLLKLQLFLSRFPRNMERKGTTEISLLIEIVVFQYSFSLSLEKRPGLTSVPGHPATDCGALPSVMLGLVGWWDSSGTDLC